MYTTSLSVSENVVVHLAQLYSSLELHIKHSRLLAPNTQPDEIKEYPVRPHLGDHRVFIPRSITLLPESERKLLKLPLVISIHGSAWIVGNPSDDDSLNRHVADHAECVVVAINHSKAPQHPFPAGLEDVIALIDAVIEDDSLSIDKDRVVLSGGSSGANLALAAALDPRFQGKFQGIIALCPPVDMTRSREEKMNTRLRREVPDILEPFYETIRTTYLEKQKDTVPMSDLRLSPTFFKSRNDYPKSMYFVGFEDDLLCREAEEMAEKLAGKAPREETDLGWRADGVVWETIPRQSHGFAPPPGESAEAKESREAETERLYWRLSDWVRKLVSAEG